MWSLMSSFSKQETPDYSSTDLIICDDDIHLIICDDDIHLDYPLLPAECEDDVIHEDDSDEQEILVPHGFRYVKLHHDKKVRHIPLLSDKWRHSSSRKPRCAECCTRRYPLNKGCTSCEL